MITERDVEWTCRACLDFENCLLKHIRDDKTCRSFHPDRAVEEVGKRRRKETRNETDIV